LETDSAVLLREATNYPFLVALATHPRADPAIVDLAVDRALLLCGPTRAFRDLSERYRTAPGLLDSRIHRSIWSRMQRRNVWVRGMDVQPSAFRRAGFSEWQAALALVEIAQRLRRGEEWTLLHDEVGGRYRRGEGCSLVGDFSSYVSSEERNEKEGGPELLVPSYHLPRLLRARAGDVVILPVKSGAYGLNVGFGRSLLLWQVLEVYEPGRDKAASQPTDH
jgi:hypothetical protein